MLTLEEMRAKIAELTQQSQQLGSKLEQLRSGTVLVSAADVAKVEKVRGGGGLPNEIWSLKVGPVWPNLWLAGPTSDWPGCSLDASVANEVAWMPCQTVAGFWALSHHH